VMQLKMLSGHGFWRTTVGAGVAAGGTAAAATGAATPAGSHGLSVTARARPSMKIERRMGTSIGPMLPAPVQSAAIDFRASAG
jgi:hypothetical protein